MASGPRPRKSAADLSTLARARRGASVESDASEDESAILGAGPSASGSRKRGGAAAAAAAAASAAAAAAAAANAGLGAVDGSEGSMSPSPSDVSSSSRTPSPISSRPGVPEYYTDGRGAGGLAGRPAVPYGQDAYDRAPVGYGVRDEDGLSRYAEIILDYFISESTTVPPLLINPPVDFDPNMSIDDDEHTALHWACAMGRIRVVKLLLSAGADVFRVNTNGQTALMRAAMFSNNYDLRKFPELFELLHRSILNIDRNDRTVFHHVVDLALSRGKPHAARYYLETMVTRLSEYGSQLADMLNFQDDEGETPLTMAARARSKRLVRLLLEYGADPKVRNKEGKNAEDYIIEDERFRASPGRAPSNVIASLFSSSNGTGNGNGAAAGNSIAPGSSTTLFPSAANLHTSEAGQRAGGRTLQLMSKLLHQLADSYDAELGAADKRLLQANSLLAQIQTEIAASGQVQQSLQRETEARDQEREQLDAATDDLRKAAQKRDASQMLQSWQQADESVKRLRTTQGLSEDKLLPPGSKPGSKEASDAHTLLAPVDAGKTVEAQIAELRTLVAEAKSKRSALIDKFVASAREQGTGKTMSFYRRLISAGCGGIQADEVDAVVTALCELLEENGEGKDAQEANRGGDSIRPQEAAAMLRGVASNHVAA